MNTYDENSNYVMRIDKNFFNYLSKSTYQVRMQFLIPIINSTQFYKLSLVDSFAFLPLPNMKYEIKHKADDSITLFLIKKEKDSVDDISKNALIVSSINSSYFSSFGLEKSMENLRSEIIHTIEKDCKPSGIINKNNIDDFITHMKNKLSGFLDKVNSGDILGLVQEYNYIEKKLLSGFVETINENNKLYESKLNHDALQAELYQNTQTNHKKNKL